MYGGFEATVRGAWRSALWVMSGLNKRYIGAPRPWGRRAPGGGVLVAFVGADGSGKSTQVAEMHKWLSAETDMLAFYFGSGDGSASLFFRPFKAAARLVASKVRVKPKGASHGTVSDRPPGPLYSALFAIWALAVALDKRTKLVAAQRAVARGFVVVTDRYPQSENPLFNDGPLLHRLPRPPAWLSRFEASIYETARRAPPDLVIKLHVGPETVAGREPQMKRNIILQRLKWLKELQFSGARVVSIDATQPLSEVTRIAKRAIWDIL
jgi:thymidylate kinase